MKTLQAPLWPTLFALLLLTACASQPEANPRGDARPGTAAAVTADGAARLYVFNISRWTRVPTNLEILDNGKVLINLPWQSYKALTIRTGLHRIRFADRQRPDVVINARPGNTYYLVVGYRPRRSWNFSVGNDPLVIRRITRHSATPLRVELIPR